MGTKIFRVFRYPLMKAFPVRRVERYRGQRGEEKIILNIYPST